MQVSFRALVGVGYQTLQSLLLDFCKWQPNKALLDALLDMLVDGKFDLEENAVVKVCVCNTLWISFLVHLKLTTSSNNYLLSLIKKVFIYWHCIIMFPLLMFDTE